jgi:hypothetical protein
MALKPCKECKQEVSTKAKSCPHCGAKNPTVSGKDTAKGCLAFIVLFAVLTVIITSCSDDTEPTQQDIQPIQQTTQEKPDNANTIKLLKISSTTLHNKPAKAIVYGENNENSCYIKLYTTSIQQGYEYTSQKIYSSDISADCSINGVYYSTSSKHPTTVSIKINSLDTESQQAVLTVYLKLVSATSKGDSYYTIPETQLKLSGDQFTAFTQ